MRAQSVWTASLSARQARDVSRALKADGYGMMSISKVRELAYVNAIAEFCEPMDLTEQNKVRRLVAEAAGIQPRRGYTIERSLTMTPMTPAEIAALNAAYEAELARRSALLEADPESRIDDSPHIVTADVAREAGLEVVRADDESGVLYRNRAGRYVYGWESGGFDDRIG